MSQHLSFSDLMEHWQEVIDPSEARSCGRMKIASEGSSASLNYFNTGYGIAYCSYDCLFSEDLIVESKEGGKGYSFLFFNTGDSVSLKERENAPEMIFGAKNFWSGKIHEGFQGIGHYCKNHHYGSRSIIFRNDLFDDLVQEELPVSENEHFSLLVSRRTDSIQELLLQELDKMVSFEGRLQEIYMESKILELIYRTYHRSDRGLEVDDLNTQDIHSIRKAKEILLQDIANPPSIKELARASAINEFKLKKGFKHLFGMTIYGMLHEERLKSAKELLEGDDVSVQEAARIVGYKSIGHFSKIFKERYRILPIEVAKGRRRYHIKEVLER
ncbi:helix-turn-helix transcriptional regulator [Wolinella succinogenes]|uniref:helix-turn-helix transcriptional regulator n=1 Tax=Wolinella succinogenes TaxID=844 RepID=UPI00240938BB|nr:AraC family transcriptional regulator [Wolinella succinogenes]